MDGTTGVPRIVGLLAAVGLLVAGNRIAPGIVQAVLLLVVLYALLTYVPRAVELINKPTRALASGFSRPGVHQQSPRR